MMSPPEFVTRGRQAAAVMLAVVLLLVGSALALNSSGRPLDWYELPWPVLVPFYILARRYGAEFVRSGESLTITMVHLPLIVGAVLVQPGPHLLAVLLSIGIWSALRHAGWLKTLVNAALGAVEIGILALSVSLVGSLTAPTAALWSALIIGIIAGEFVSFVALNTVVHLVGQPVTPARVVRDYMHQTVGTLLFSGLGVLMLSAAWVEPLSVFVVGAMSAISVLGYRAFSRLEAQQQATGRMYEFVKGLGPVTPEQTVLEPVLDQIRLLMHADIVELEIFPNTARAAIRSASSAPSAVAQIRGRQQPVLATDSISTPLVERGRPLGLLKVIGRLGEIRGFDIQDVRLLETIGAELVAALERGQLLEDLSVAATLDALTGLPNLRQTGAEIDMLLAKGQVIVAAVSVYGFREVNDTLGHPIGNELLREVGARLQRSTPQAVVGRIGGGRFAVGILADDVGADAALFGLSLRTAVEGGLEVGAVGTHIRLSVGCVLGPDHGQEAATLLRRAETAMYSARDAGGGPVLWEPAYEVMGQRRMAVVMALREAVASGAVGVAYQPKMRSDGSVSGVEALARWTHVALGDVNPDEFIPLAEASGLIDALTSSMLRQALVDCKSWQVQHSGVGVAVNVSASTILDTGFVGDVRDSLAHAELSPELLTLELTESVVLAEPERAVERMQELRRLGVRLSVDDFGTGYSSLTYLKGLPVHEVKIDRGFVTQLVTDAADQAVVRAVVDIAHTLGMRVVAEGVEIEDQRSMLIRLGVDEFQGFLLSRPLPAAQMAALLQSTSHRTV